MRVFACGRGWLYICSALLSLIGRGIADAFVISSSRFRALLEIQQLVLDSQRALPELASFTDQYFLNLFFVVTTPSNRHWHRLSFMSCWYE